MRFVGGTLVFALALFFGVSGVWVWADFMTPEIDGKTILAPLEFKTTSTGCYLGEPTTVAALEGIRVIYNGTGKNIDFAETYLSFLIRNDTREPQSYAADWSTSPFPILRADGKEIQAPWCCPTGNWFSIPPGSSVEVRVFPRDFRTRPTKNARISAGFQLAPPNAMRSTQHYSEPFPLPDEFRKLIANN